MKSGFFRIIALVFIWAAMIVFLVSSASAQVLTTAVTGGKGGQALMVSVNDIPAEGDGETLINGYFQYFRGVSDRLDIGPILGDVSVAGAHQFYAGLGWNLNLVRTVVDISFFGVAITPLGRRDEASVVLLAPALVASRTFENHGFPLSLYTGINTTIPVGQRKDKVFTAPGSSWTIPVGLATNITGPWTIHLEVDFRDKVNAVGACLIRAW